MNGESLSRQELALYTLIARHYLAQFYPPLQRRETRIGIEIAGGQFLAKGREILLPGWRVVLSADRADEEPESRLPLLRQGDVVHCERGERIDKQTQPPKPFTDATLLAAMTGIARYVQDSSLRQILRETDGLGTEATRAGILELLFQRGFLQHQGKSIRATEMGKALIRALPVAASLPDMTARWERALSAIEQRELPYQSFMQPLQQELSRLIAEAQSGHESVRELFAAMPAAPTRVAGQGYRQRKGKSSSSRRPSAPHSAADASPAPSRTPRKAPVRKRRAKATPL
ncbi:MAG: DNA topoisomerase III, partial [Aeromonadaceae bacterium]|nr:DNA topoisomerase III [Aeromonadaceae bacterium]